VSDQEIQKTEALLKLNQVTQEDSLWRVAKNGDSAVSFWITIAIGIA
jgi:hypothetical protein